MDKKKEKSNAASGGHGEKCRDLKEPVMASLFKQVIREFGSEGGRNLRTVSATGDEESGFCESVPIP